MTARLVVLVTTPRLPGGLLTAPAWQALQSAELVVAPAASPLVEAVRSAGIDVAIRPDAALADLLGLAADQVVIWLPPDDADVTTALATHVVRRSEADGTDEAPLVEVLVGSFDPRGARLLDLVEVMDTLRRDCPWDQEQTHESLVRYLVEETYETIDAIESGDRQHLREELGDLLLQVVFHARIASEHGDAAFTIDDVAGDIVEKLVRRHPHVFGDVAVDGVGDVEANWESIKTTEKARNSVVGDIPAGLPALSLAAKVVSRVQRSAGPLSVPVPDPGEPEQAAYDEQTLGDVLFALVAAATAAGLDPEQALRQRVRSEIEQVRVHEQRALTDREAAPG